MLNLRTTTLVVVVLAACGPLPASMDGGMDTGNVIADSGVMFDAGQPDAGETDAGETDAGETDAGETDAGETDAGETDAGEIDAGETDAGEIDAGETDAGETDAGIDAGADAGIDAGVVCPATTPPQIVRNVPGSTILRGTVVTPTQTFEGEVLVVGDTITCAAPSCGDAGVIVETNGIILPGLIDTHNHVLFDIFDETDWAPLQSYLNHNQWTNEARYGAMVDAKQYLNGESAGPDYGCELDKYGELKALVAGTTSIVGVANPTNRACYGTLARTIDQTPNGLGSDKIQAATLMPNTASADAVCNNFADSSTDAYLIHVGEGIDQTSRNEFVTLNTVTTVDGCLYSPKTAIVNGTSLQDPELTIMAQNSMSLVWSPRSNVTLYGATGMANIPLAVSKGINVALGPDWSLTGSQNLLDELRFADQLDNTSWANVLTPQMLTDMVTVNAARALGLDAVLGSIAPGKKADLMVIEGDRCAPHQALLAATPDKVRLVMVGGVVLYGDAALQPLGPATPGCEALDVCTVNKFVCVATTGGTATNKFAQTYTQIQSTLSTAMSTYDALNLSQWDFAPITPLVRCTP